MASTFDTPEPIDNWDRVAGELRALRQSQHEAYGDIDNATLGRYLAGEVDDAERAAVESALGDHPELRLLTDLVRDVLADVPAVSFEPLPLAVPEPAVLPFRPRRRAGGWRRYGALAAAACLAVAFGAGLTPLVPGMRPAPDAVALGGSIQGDVALRGDDTILAASIPAPDAKKPAWERRALHVGQNGVRQRREGELEQAAKTFEEARAICRAKGGPDHPTTRAVEMNLAGVYGAALNNAPPNPYHTGSNPYFDTKSPRGPGALGHFAGPPPPPGSPRGVRMPQATALRVQIDRQNTADVQKRVVPVLASALCNARAPEARRALVAALAELGPSAAPAVPALIQRLSSSDDAAESAAILDALGKMGATSPEAREAVEKASGRRIAQDALVRLRGPEGRVGVVDTAGLFTVGGVRDASDAARGLSATVEVYVVTRGPDPAGFNPTVRLGHMGKKAVVIVLQKEAAEVYPSPALRKAGFAADEVKKAMTTALKAGEADKALAEGMQLIGRKAK